MTDDILKPSKRAAHRPWGLDRSSWFHMSREVRRMHRWCCWQENSNFAREEIDKGRNFWIPKEDQ